MKTIKENNANNATRMGTEPLRNHKDSTFCLLFSERSGQSSFTTR